MRVGSVRVIMCSNFKAFFPAKSEKFYAESGGDSAVKLWLLHCNGGCEQESPLCPAKIFMSTSGCHLTIAAM